ncbi:multidrug effflux MFS transporter [Conexibacter sp. CPCC 206217]|uniref:multidrug effflux MFS transporter n=1 Tax=Conexibacter sp. CPCC 206217 TaxID=3064574 RepID=UPI00271BF879|nr:multidrug effflux MFS transporter [Conexibacter sp. CPCC 206217]MDO8213181.1 multidrug effflux MFS transporter [Conexibacter sp. CPCC 206217]
MTGTTTRGGPRSAPPPESVRFFLLLGCLSAVGPAAMDLYLSSLPTVARELDVTTSAAQLTISLYLVGMALGQFVFGQLADVVGRRLPLLGGLVLFVLASLLCAVSPSLPVLCAGRLLQGAAGACGMAIGRTVVRDLFGLRDSARYYSRLTLIYGVAPIVAPTIGATILRVASWHGIFVVQACFGILLVIGAFVWFPETLPKEARRSGTLADTMQTFGALLRHRRFVGCTATLGLTMGALIVFVSSATFVIEDGYGASPQLFGILYGINAAAMVTSNQINAHLLHRFAPTRLAGFGLCMMVTGAAGVLVVELAGFGLIALEASWACMLGSWGFVQGNTIAIGLSEHGHVAGSGSALMGVFQYTMGAVAAPLAGLGGGDSAVVPAIVALSCAGAAAVVSFSLVLRRPPPQAPIVEEPLELL